VKLASLQPASPEELAEIPGIGQGLMDRYASDLLLIIRESHTSPPPTRPKQRHVQDEIVQRRFDVLHTWRKERAAKRGVSSEVILSKDALWELAQLAPKSRRELETIQSLGPWRLEAYGDELLAILASLDP
jgi:ribonuclease D